LLVNPLPAKVADREDFALTIFVGRGEDDRPLPVELGFATAAGRTVGKEVHAKTPVSIMPLG
jgi:hypothetical protein